MSGDIYGSWNLSKKHCWSGTHGAEAKEAAKHPTTHRTSPQNVNSTESDHSSSQVLMEQKWQKHPIHASASPWGSRYHELKSEPSQWFKPAMPFMSSTVLNEVLFWGCDPENPNTYTEPLLTLLQAQTSGKMCMIPCVLLIFHLRPSGL